MKKINNSLLLFRINPDKDNVKCIFIYFINWFTFKIEINTFDFSKLNMKQVIEFHKLLENEWNGIYRI